MSDVILAARDRGLFTAVTDCGAGGLSSAIGEMGEKIGASVELDQVPLKYAGLRYDEIWISEAQERMVLSAPKESIAELLKLAADEDVEATVIGTFGTENHELILRYRGTEVGRLSMAFLHDGLPMPTRKAVVTVRDRARPEQETKRGSISRDEFRDQLLKKLSHPNIASKHWIIRQYDHEVQGGSVIKPLAGPLQVGPSDAAVIRPKLSSMRGVAMGCGLAPWIEDPYEMALAAIDEAIRNVVAVGADPKRTAILDNFCWPSVENERTMGTLVRACEACRDAALAYRIPFISGKDSLHNQFTNQETGEVLRIPPTLLISAIGIVEDVRKCVTMDFKQMGAALYLVEPDNPADPASLAATHAAVARSIAEGQVSACHDISEGGLAVAAAEMCIASGHGITLDPDVLSWHDPFADRSGCYLVEMRVMPNAPTNPATFARGFKPAKATLVGFVQGCEGIGARMILTNSRDAHSGVQAMVIADVAELTAAWRGTLDW